jgi:hypothetical protein
MYKTPFEALSTEVDLFCEGLGYRLAIAKRVSKNFLELFSGCL